MVTIRQHGNRQELFDIARLLADIDRFVPPDAWHVAVEWCVGERATEIERMTASGRLMSDAEFRSIYSGVRQTIDGRFTGLRNEAPLFELVAVDSSFWEVTGPQSFESHMLNTYGAWGPGSQVSTD